MLEDERLDEIQHLRSALMIARKELDSLLRTAQADDGSPIGDKSVLEVIDRALSYGILRTRA